MAKIEIEKYYTQAREALWWARTVEAHEATKRLEKIVDEIVQQEPEKKETVGSFSKQTLVDIVEYTKGG